MKKQFLIILVALLWCNVGVAGCSEGNCQTGQGTYIFENGDKYVGEFRSGYADGQGTFTFASPDILKRSKFVGEYINGHPGDGIWTFTNGTVCDSSKCSAGRRCNYFGCM